MEKTYFIRKSLDNNYKNKIDGMLHQAFEKYNGHIISEDNLEVFDHEHEFVVNKYQMANGRAAIPHYFRHKPSGQRESILINISESLSLILDPIKGKIIV